MNKELKSVKSEMNEFKSEMQNRFDKVEVKLEGIGGQIEPTNESRMDDFDFSNRIKKKYFGSFHCFSIYLLLHELNGTLGIRSIILFFLFGS